MNLPEYEYKGLMAQAWDVLRGDTSTWPDRFFFREVIAQYGQPVLDVGCGTGRLLLDYAAAGIDIDGVDNSPEMLDLCRKKALDVSPAMHEQYVEELSLPRQYKTILVPSSSLQLIIDPSAVRETLTRLFEHLLPGGVVVAPIMTLWQEGEPLDNEAIRTGIRPVDGATIRRVARFRYDPAEECEHTEDLYQLIIEGEVVAEELHRRSPATRSYTQPQATALFESIGFASVTLYHEFTFDPVKPGDTLFTIIAQKATE